MRHTDSIHAFKMADKIARQEDHRVEYLNELLKTSQKLLLPQYSPLKIKVQLALNHCLGSAEILVLNNCQPYFYSVLETNSSTSQPSAGHQNFIQAKLCSTHCNIIFKHLKSSLKKDINDNKPFRPQIKSLNH